ncbi:MAG: GAF domain-containing protein, partial [Chloroflexota bacterium]
MAQVDTPSNQKSVDQDTNLFNTETDLINKMKWAKYVPAATLGIFCAIVAIFAYQFFIPNSQSLLTFALIAAVLLLVFLLIGYLFSAFLSSKKEIERLERHAAVMHENHQFMQDMLNKQQDIQSDLLARQDLSDRLLRMVRSTAMTTSLEVALEKILDAACTITHAELGSLLLVDSTGKVTNSYLSRRSNSGDESKKLVGQVMRDGLASWIFRTGQAVILTDARNDDRWITLPDAPYEAGSVLGVPINSGTVVTGILTLIHQRKSHFRNDDLELMQDAASQIALALRNAQIFEEQKRMVDRQTSLYDVLQLISQKLSPESVEVSAVKKVSELTGWTTATILRPDETGSFLEPRAKEGIYPPGSHYRIPINDESAAGDAFLNCKRVEIINTLGLANHVPLHAKTRSEVYVPLQNRGVVEGLLAFGDAKPYAFSDDEVALVESVAEATSLAITNAHLFQETSEQQGRLEALINTSNDGIIMIGRDQDVLVINRTAQNLLNLDGNPDDWLAKPMQALYEQLSHSGFSNFSENFSNQLKKLRLSDPEEINLEVQEYDLAS